MDFRVLLLATGIHVPVIPEIMGNEHLEGYETVSVVPEDYNGQSVLILGKGNSGLEMAASIYGHANFVHLVGRDRVKFSWDTHYVGDIRAVNNEVLDAYMLKSLDGVFEVDTSDIHVWKREDGKLMLKSISIPELDTIDQNPVRDGYDRIIRCLGFKWDNIEALHNLLEWKYHGLKWPFLKKQWTHLLSTFLKRANEGSGIYQMFQNLGDVAIINRQERSFIYLEEFPVNLIDRLTEETGHCYDSSTNFLMVFLLEYGYNFSVPGDDHFGDSRAHGSVDEAHMSNFLHPVIYFYRNLPSVSDCSGLRRGYGHVCYHALESDMKTKSQFETLPKPDGIHHVLEDFTTTFDGPTTHMLPLRRFLEFFLHDDLRAISEETCIKFGLQTNRGIPLACQLYFESEDSILAWT